MFLNQGLGVGCMAALHVPRWEQAVPAPLVLAAGVALFVVGLVVKLWATLTVGVDVYYFRDMFLGRPLATACDGGPYRFLRNPMYSLGQLQGYGYALLYGSLPGRRRRRRRPRAHLRVLRRGRAPVRARHVHHAAPGPDDHVGTAVRSQRSRSAPSPQA